MAQADVERLYREIMSLTGEEKLNPGYTPSGITQQEGPRL